VCPVAKWNKECRRNERCIQLAASQLFLQDAYRYIPDAGCINKEIRYSGLSRESVHRNKVDLIVREIIVLRMIVAE